jgi:hypothetical protein
MRFSSFTREKTHITLRMCDVPFRTDQAGCLDFQNRAAACG